MLKVKAELTSLSITNSDYLKSILTVKEKVKALKEDLKKLEGEAPQLEAGALDARINGFLADLPKAEEAGREIFGKHNKWYLGGAR